MEDNRAVIRDAKPEDAELIAKCVMAALGVDDGAGPADCLKDICKDVETLYSWKNTRVCELDGVPAGVMVSYEGSRYKAMRLRTFEWVKRCGGPDLLDNPMETGDGEYYLDSLGALPQFRGSGIGRILLEDAISRAKDAGYRDITLIADPMHPRLIAYYESIGFRTFGEEETFFGSSFIHMRLS